MVHVPVLRKYINAFSSYSAKTKSDGRTDGRTDRQTDGWGELLYLPSRASGAAEIKIGGFRKCHHECSIKLIHGYIAFKDFGDTKSVAMNAVLVLI